MKTRYRIIRRGNRGNRAGMFYSVDKTTGKRSSLQTTDPHEAARLLAAMNEACQQAAMNLSLARVYLRHSDPLTAVRTWQHVLDEIIRTKTGENQIRWQVMAKSKWFDPLRNRLLIETQAEHLLRVLQCGKVSVNVYLRRMHNFALDMNWLAACVLPKRQWPAVEFKEKRGITLAEHLAIVAREQNPERKAFYKLAWHLGASQTDLAGLNAEDVDWEQHIISYARRKTGSIAIMRMDQDIEEILRDLPGTGPLFPYLRTVRAGDRATEFGQRCRGLGIHGVTLHSYRYAWAERAMMAGYPERYAQVNLGHNSRAMARAYSRKALVEMPSLSEYERQQKAITRNFKPTAKAVAI